MRYSSVRWRGLGLLVFGLLGIFGTPAVAQVSAEIWARDDGYSVSRSLDALETSRAALLEARAAIDAALIEVDGALVAVRSVLPEQEGAMAATGGDVATGDIAADGPTVFPRVRASLHAALERLGARLVDEIAGWEMKLPLPAEEISPQASGEDELAEDVSEEPLPLEAVPAVSSQEEDTVGIEASGFDEEAWWENESGEGWYAHQTYEPANEESETLPPEPASAVEAEVAGEVSPAPSSERGDQDDAWGTPLEDDPESDPGNLESPAFPALPTEGDEYDPAADAPSGPSEETLPLWDGIPGQPWDPCIPPFTAKSDPSIPNGEGDGNQ